MFPLPTIRGVVAFAVGVVASISASAQHFPMRGPILADTGSAHYRFATHALDSRDGERHYRIWIGVPAAPPPAAGYPVIYMLDGNAVMDELRDDWLAPRRGVDAPVIVAIGYATDQRVDVKARAFDFTPPLAGQPAVDPLAPDRRNGGADLFLDLIEQRIKPLASASAPIDAQRQTLWGHSYGGLFALHALATRPGSFRNYFAADPSLWWRDGELFRRALDFRSDGAVHGVALLLATARDEPPPADAVHAQLRRRIRDAVPADGPQRVRDHFAAQEGMRVCYREYPDLTHGPLLGAAIAPALVWAGGGACP